MLSAVWPSKHHELAGMDSPSTRSASFPSIYRALSGTTVGQLSRTTTTSPRINIPKQSPSISALQPSLPAETISLLDNANNFAKVSEVDVLSVTGSGSGWTLRASDEEAETALRSTMSSCSATEPSLVAFIVYLEKQETATYFRRASATRNFVTLLLGEFVIHDAFLHDLFGRPDYWAAGNNKRQSGPELDVLEFWCQHPRWTMNSRHKAGGPVAPCSTYMHHSQERNLTLYIISGSRNDSCITAFQKQMGYFEGSGFCPAVESTRLAAAKSPFYIHTQILGTSFEQSKDYVATVRNNLMNSITKVNDYTDKSIENRHSSASRDLLQSITVELHSVSQTTDSGMANADMSIRLTESLCEAFNDRAEHAVASDSLMQTRQSLQYLIASWHSQRSWLWHYKARKDTAMGFVFNTVTQQDSAVNIETARNMARDSSSMNAITILTMIFLPATFVAGVFNSGIVSSVEVGDYYVSPLLLPFVYTVIPFTLIVVLFYFFRGRVSRISATIVERMRQGRRKEQDDHDGIV